MINFFNWIASLPEQTAWLMFAALAGLMALFPFLGTIWIASKILLRNEKPRILDFSWSFIPSQKYPSDSNRNLYVSPSENPIIYEGMVIMLCWNIEGAFRVDVLPVKKHMKGNVAFVPIRKGSNLFTLVAYTWRGKIQREIVIESTEVRKLNTLNISGETYFGQPIQKLHTQYWRKKSFMGLLYSRSLLRLNHSIYTKRIDSKPAKPRAIYTNMLEYFPFLKEQKQAVIKRAEDQNLIKTYTFNPKLYNKAIHQFNQEQQEII
jgi:hypothetical protein